MPKILTAADLVENETTHEVTRAFEMLQQGGSPESIIHELRGEVSQLLDPDLFAADVQRLYEEMLLMRVRSAEDSRE